MRIYIGLLLLSFFVASGCSSPKLMSARSIAPAFVSENGVPKTLFAITSSWDTGQGMYSTTRGPLLVTLVDAERTDDEYLSQKALRAPINRDVLAMTKACAFARQSSDALRERTFWVLSITPPVLGYALNTKAEAIGDPLGARVRVLITEDRKALKLDGYFIGAPSLWKVAKDAKSPESLTPVMGDDVRLNEPMLAASLIEKKPWLSK